MSSDRPRRPRVGDDGRPGRAGPVASAVVAVFGALAALLRRLSAWITGHHRPPSAAPPPTDDGEPEGDGPGGPDERDRRDLLRAVAASELEPVELTRLDHGDGSHQWLAVGPAPTRSALPIALLLLASAACAVGFAVVYAVDGSHVLQGVLLGGALLGMGVSLVAWGARLLPETLSLERREPLDQGQRAALETDLSRPELARPGRRVLLGSLVGAAGAFLVAAAFPLRSLGPKPGNALSTTAWRAGLRLVTADGRPVHRDDIPLDGALTVFPEGHTDAGDSQVMLLRVPDGLLSPGTASGGVVDGRVAYSKVCTHAGCPVAQFRVDSRPPITSYELLCPCHQSLFDVLDGARPIAGPAASPLPQLPLAVDDGGYLVATGDFPAPIGPSYWDEP